ncbi:MAG: hypothetical protein ACXWQO_19800 [Bdellovibrionota bacterium]
MASNQQNNDFFFDPEHDEAEELSAASTFSAPSFSAEIPSHLEKKRDYLERLLQAWQSAHSAKKKKAA